MQVRRVSAPGCLPPPRVQLGAETVRCMRRLPHGSDAAELLLSAQLIVWDEVSMMDRQAFEAFDRSMQDVARNDVLFGGKVVVLGGDFRQIPPVVVRGGTDEVVRASLRSSRLFPKLHRLRLSINMRVQRAAAGGDPAAAQAAQAWGALVLSIGEGKAPVVAEAGEFHIRLPDGITLQTGAPPPLHLAPAWRVRP